MNYTVFTNVKAENFSGMLKGGVKSAALLTKSAAYSLSAAEKKSLFIGITMSAASKVLTLGLDDGQIAFVHNTGGTNAVTVKNVSGDTGTSLDAGKTLLVVGSQTANGSLVIALN